jgi:hypothetical protein
MAKKSKSNRCFCLLEVKDLTRGLPWTVEEEMQLKKLIEAKTPLDVIASTLGRQAPAILVKCQRLGLPISGRVTAAALPLPSDLPSVEETLRKLAGALEAASAPGLSGIELQRLQLIATLARTYKEILADYLNFREIEAKLTDMEAKYAQLLQTKSQSNAPQPTAESMAKTPTD